MLFLDIMLSLMSWLYDIVRIDCSKPPVTRLGTQFTQTTHLFYFCKEINWVFAIGRSLERHGQRLFSRISANYIRTQL